MYVPAVRVHIGVGLRLDVFELDEFGLVGNSEFFKNNDHLHAHCHSMSDLARWQGQGMSSGIFATARSPSMDWGRKHGSRG